MPNAVKEGSGHHARRLDRSELAFKKVTPIDTNRYGDSGGPLYTILMRERTGRSIGLSKSRVMAGLQCPKRIYLQLNSPELALPISAVEQARFDEGSEVGRRARERFPGGVLIDTDPAATSRALSQTQEAMVAGALALFEPAFAHEGVLVRVDILVREELHAPWSVIEVKSSTSVKEEHLDDVAIQAWVLRGSGEQVGRCSVMFINNSCVFPDLENLFFIKDVTREIKDRESSIPRKISELKKVLLKPEVPPVDIGPHCNAPYVCPFTGYCWEERGVVSPNIFELPGIGKRAWEFYQHGIISLTDGRIGGLNGKQARALEVARSNLMWIDRMGILNGVKDWKWPLHCLDFETFGPAIPRYPGVRSYQQVPFQFSCHVQDKPGAEPRHFEYLHENSGDPRPAVAKALCAAIGPTGSIVAYNKSVESRIIAHLAEVCPAQARDLERMAGRFVDPLPIIRGSVYAPGFRGSYSIKDVAPALLGRSFAYEGMDVGGGQEAQMAFDRLISGALSMEERQSLRNAMLAYCRQDTLAMLRIVDWLFEQISE